MGLSSFLPMHGFYKRQRGRVIIDWLALSRLSQHGWRRVYASHSPGMDISGHHL